MKNPNAIAAGGTIGPGVLVVWLLGHFGVDMSAEVGVTIGGLAAGLLLFVGRNGLQGVWKRVWRGEQAP